MSSNGIYYMDLKNEGLATDITGNTILPSYFSKMAPMAQWLRYWPMGWWVLSLHLSISSNSKWVFKAPVGRYKATTSCFLSLMTAEVYVQDSMLEP